MPKKISDEKLLSALLTFGSVGKTADCIGLTRAAIYKRLADPDFRQRFDDMQGVLLSSTAAQMCDGLSEAVAALLEVIRDTNAAASVRISASDALLRHCNRYLESANIMRRLDALEQAQNENIS
ncbi:MAG: hypothetical protein KBS74_07590 [Clostridiales bacterium]|nr:hypothetical protein [Candidatus Cacconaster stercorequi]